MPRITPHQKSVRLAPSINHLKEYMKRLDKFIQPLEEYQKKRIQSEKAS
jgi:nitrate/nitrite-specific signal transduction histidine kinase